MSPKSSAIASVTEAPADILAVAAHELRHPLHLMRMAIARYLGDEPHTRETLERYIERMVRLTDDIVDYIHSDQGTLQLHCEWIDVHTFLLDLLEDYRSTFDERKVRLSVAAAVGVRVHADPQRLMQVFSNLLDNALTFTPAGGTVTVSAIANTRNVSIIVRDSGRGLSNPPFVRGLGIGLSVARRVVELHGGTMAVHSDGPGPGTEAVITLPIA